MRPTLPMAQTKKAIISFATILSIFSLLLHIFPPDFIQHSFIKPDLKYEVVCTFETDTVKKIIGHITIRNEGMYYEEDLRIGLLLLANDRISFDGTVMPDSISTYHKYNVKNMMITYPKRFHPGDSLVINFISTYNSINEYRTSKVYDKEKPYSHPRIKFIQGKFGSYPTSCIKNDFFG